MGYEAMSVLSVLVAVALMIVVVRRHGSVDEPMSFGELAGVATIWAITMGPAMYLNPGLARDGFFSPPISGTDKALFWVLALLFGMAALRTFTRRGAFGRKVATAFAGTCLAFLVFLGLGATFGTRDLGSPAPPVTTPTMK